jgi:L-cysteate sulfo-lyase
MPSPVLTTEQVREATHGLPRVDLAHLPTPLEEVPNFADRFHGPRVFIKRDDCTGLLFGGNKTRHNEFILADALQHGADMIVWGAGIQSNNCRQTAAGCAKLGLECRLYLSKAGKLPKGEVPPLSRGSGPLPKYVQGNLLLDYLVGARVELVDAVIGPELDQLLLDKAAAFKSAGRRPYVWDRHHVTPLAAISYVLCLAEIVDQVKAANLKLAAVYASSSGSTGAGLALGKKLLGLSCPVRLQAPIHWPWNTQQDLAEVASRAAAILDLPHRLRPEDVEVSEEFMGPGYGKASAEGAEALQLLAVTEGILLDPVYTAKAMAALIADIRREVLEPDDGVVVFIHTGGSPAIFAYPDEIMEPYLTTTNPTT